MFVCNDFLSCMAKDARLSSRVLARASPHTRLSTRVLQCTHKSQIWLLNQNQNEHTQTVFMSYSKAVCTSFLNKGQ